ncbi:hypothetical protein N4P33_03930 [Streptomyces sp. 15-116A]|uniref:hypothetical protein n=1 Tax=Streptomyces sp. 15-116A TaxID=2259035 RepID=UPI0021B42423|nr:hypothetical protein [Streptomyces sp. 15-116A]MCT7351317.1 hypothetical protein [Streptomyces sp. 15-116A]
MGASEFLDLIRNITNTEARVRERAADEVTDWLSSYSAAEAAALATILAATAASEKDHAALEAQLHAISELTSTGNVRVTHISHLREIDLLGLSTEAREYVVDLLEG